MHKVKYRSALISDLPILYEFEQGIVTAERPFDPTLKSGHINYYDLKALIESNDTKVIVALSDDEIIGSSYVKIKKAEPFQNFEHYAYLGFMFIKPEHRGKGISQNIIEQLKTWAKSRYLTELRLEVYSENRRAIKAYEKVGLQKHMVEMRVEI